MTETDPFSNAPALPAGSSQDDGVPRDRYGRYLLTDPETGTVKPWTRATTFAKSISDTFTLSQWSQRMVGIGVAQNPDLLATFASHGVNDRAILNAAAEEAKNRAGAKTGANLGTAVHSFTHRADLGEIEVDTIPEPWRRDVRAYRALFEQEGLQIVRELMEKRVLEPVHGIAGTFDRIVRITRDTDVRMHDPLTGSKKIVTLKAGELIVLDLKTGRDLEYGWLEIAIQLAIYARAKWIYSDSGDYGDMPEVRTDVALVVHLPVGQGKATLHAVSIEQGWKFAALCASVREARKARGLAEIVGVVEIGNEIETPIETEGPIRVSSERVRDPEWAERVAAARTVADLSILRREAMIARAWSPTIERLALERRDAILADTVAG